MKIKSQSLVGIIMGSKSDWKTMIHCSKTLKKFNINKNNIAIKLRELFLLKINKLTNN